MNLNRSSSLPNFSLHSQLDFLQLLLQFPWSLSRAGAPWSLCRRVLCVPGTSSVVIAAASKTFLIGNLFLSHRSVKLACLVFWNNWWQLRKREFSVGIVHVVFLHGIACSCVTVLNAFHASVKNKVCNAQIQVILRPVNRILSELQEGFFTQNHWHFPATPFQYLLLLKIASQNHVNMPEIFLLFWYCLSNWITSSMYLVR